MLSNSPHLRISADEAAKDSRLPRVFFILESSPSICVRYTLDGQEIKENFHVDYHNTNFRGCRICFLCPKCQRKVRHLYLWNEYYYNHGLKLWRCRHCLGLKYMCQVRHRYWDYEFNSRYASKQEKISMKLSNRCLRKSTRETLEKKFDEITKERLRKIREYRTKKYRKYL